MAGAFSGVRIVDLTRELPGALAGMLLADFEADVVRVERPGDRRDAARRAGWDRNKRAVELDLGRDRATARRLIGAADVALFDDSSESERESLLEGGPPSLLEVRLPHWGAAGEWSGLPADETLLWGMSGAAFAQFSWDDVPVHLVTPQLGYAHGMLAAFATAAALYERAHSGRGQQLVVSGLHALSAIQSGLALRAGDGRRSRAIGARGTAPNYKLYECAGGEWLFLATLIPAHFRRALDALELTESLLQLEGVDGEVANVLKRGVGGRVRAHLEAHFKSRPRAEWLELLRAHDVPAGPVGTRDAWFAGETVAANCMRVDLDHPELGPLQVPGVPVSLSSTPGSVRHAKRATRAADLLREWGGPRERPAHGGPAAAGGGGPLAGVRVLDLGVIIAAPFASTLIANLGADVVKVEPPAGDPFRPYGLGFVAYNQGKRSVALDLKRPEGLDAFLDLVRGADVVSDNYRLGVLERLGIDYPRLREINPRLVQASVTAYGTRGARAREPGFDPLLQAQSGMMAAQGGDDEPVFHQVAVNDTASAMVVAFGIAAALYAREVGGRGQRVETSLAAQSVLCQSGEVLRYPGRPDPPRGGRDCLGLGALRRYYACADAWIGVACREAGAYASLLGALGRDDLAADWPADRALAAPWDGALAAALAETLAALPRALALERLRAAGVPAAPVTRVEELPDSPLHRANAYFEDLDHPDHGKLHGVRGFADLSRTPGGFARRSPGLGEHGAEVLAEAGLDAARVRALVAPGPSGGAGDGTPE